MTARKKFEEMPETKKIQDPNKLPINAIYLYQHPHTKKQGIKHA